jgi:tetratricopeptide (TPR) repeat protein
VFVSTCSVQQEQSSTRLSGNEDMTKSVWRSAVILAVFALIALALARPQMGFIHALFLLGFSLSLATAATGLEEYEAGNFENAKADFERRLQATPQSDKLHFNAGAASYKLGDFAKAVDHFTQSLLSGDPKLREDLPGWLWQPVSRFSLS